MGSRSARITAAAILVGASALLALAAGSPGRGARSASTTPTLRTPRTIVSVKGRIGAFAQDGALLGVVTRSISHHQLYLITGAIGAPLDRTVALLESDCDPCRGVPVVPLAGDGRTLVYLWSGVRRVVGAGSVSLYVALAGATTSSFRPSGRIVYAAALDGGGQALFVAAADGSHARKITAGPNDFSPRWSPDGRRIAFVRSAERGVTAIWVVNANGFGARPLDEDHPYAEYPRWSPNGRWIAYQVQTSTHVLTGLRAHTTYELWLVRPDGSERRRLVAGPGEVVNDNPLYSVAAGAWAWSPGGRRIAFVGGPEGAERVRIVDVATGRTRSRGPGSDVAWSPDGRRVATTVDASFVIAQPACGTVWVVPRDSGRRRLLARPPKSANEPCDLWARWSPDGRSIVFLRSTSEGGGQGQLLISRPDGMRQQRVLQLPLAQYRWPATCGRPFEYASGYGSGWIVHPSPRGAARFVRFPRGGRPHCDPDSEEPCESAGDWHCGGPG